MRSEKPYSTRPAEALSKMPSDSEQFVTFMNMDFELGPSVVVPRAESELFATVCIERLAQGTIAPVVIDIFCGCGNLSIVVATHIGEAQVWACDPSPETVDLAWRNVIRFGLQRRISVVQGYMFEGIKNIGLESKVDLVLCSLPCIPGKQTQDRGAYAAFDDDWHLASIQQRLIEEAVDFLKPNGWIAFEFDQGQERQAAAILSRARAYGSVQFILDPSGSPCVALAMKHAATQ